MYFHKVLKNRAKIQINSYRFGKFSGYNSGMTEPTTALRFTFGEHPACVEMLRHTMAAMKEAGAKVAVETELFGKQKFVLHTVVAVPPKKTNPIVFTRAAGAL